MIANVFFSNMSIFVQLRPSYPHRTKMYRVYKITIYLTQDMKYLLGAPSSKIIFLFFSASETIRHTVKKKVSTPYLHRYLPNVSQVSQVPTYLQHKLFYIYLHNFNFLFCLLQVKRSRKNEVFPYKIRRKVGKVSGNKCRK